jgi:hypothetical protein
MGFFFLWARPLSQERKVNLDANVDHDMVHPSSNHDVTHDVAKGCGAGAQFFPSDDGRQKSIARKNDVGRRTIAVFIRVITAADLSSSGAWFITTRSYQACAEFFSWSEKSSAKETIKSNAPYWSSTM